MGTPHWVVRWHGEKWPLTATVAQGSTGGGGSTSMSTGVANALSTKASLGHTHPTSEISNLDSTLAGLAAAISTKAAGSHGHAQADVTGLTSTLANVSTSLTALSSGLSSKADAVHSHAIADVTGLASTLANLAAQISTKAAGSHTHPTSDVTGLDAALSTKASLASGIVPNAQLGSGTADNTVFLRGDRTWAAPTAAASGVIPSTWAVVSTHVLTGSTTMQSVTGLSFALSSARVYQFEFTVGWQTTSSAAGIALGVNGPAGPTLLAWEARISTGMGGLLTRMHNAFGAQQIAVPQSSAANIDNFGYLGGVVRTGANAGTLQLQFATEVAGSTVSVRGGSVGFLFGPL